MNVVILGAGYAGLTAALRLARRSRGAAHVTLVNASDLFVERIRVHERAAGRKSRARPIAELLRGSGVSLVVGACTAVDRVRGTVEVNGALYPWDRLVLALGSRIDLGVPGAGAHAAPLDAAFAGPIAEAMPALAARRGRVVVVGGGLTGIEAASELAEAYAGLSVAIVTRGELGAGFSDAARAHFARALERLGVDVLEGRTVARVEPGGLATNAGRVDFDLCVWALGFVGAPLPRGLELARNARGQVLVDPFLRSVTDARISVAGDLAAPVEPRGQGLPMGCKSAGPAGAFVADDLVRLVRGGPESPFDFAAPIYCVSLGRRDGVIQRVLPDGSLEGPVLRGRAAALVKELICRSTVAAFALERAGWMSYAATRSKAVPRLGTRTGREDLAA